MRASNPSFLAMSLLFASASTAAIAEPGDSAQESGVAAATVADPMNIRRVSDLRFGRFASPSTASTITIDPDGTFAPTGEVAASTGMAQPADGRGPAQFLIDQSGKRTGQVDLPVEIILSNGSETMTVINLTSELTQMSKSGRDQTYRLDIGGTLQVEALQAPGRYVGEFAVTVSYN